MDFDKREPTWGDFSLGVLFFLGFFGFQIFCAFGAHVVVSTLVNGGLCFICVVGGYSNYRDRIQRYHARKAEEAQPVATPSVPAHTDDLH